MVDGARIQAEVEAAAQARSEHERLTGRLEEARGRVAALQSEVERLRARLDEESADVERLESFSPARIWAALKGSRTQDLERETAEREAARYAVAEAEARRAGAEADRERIEVALADLGDVEGRLEEALSAREAFAVSADPELAARLTELSTRRGELLARDQGNREAYDAGCVAGDHLARAAGLLGDAGTWATWDTFGGGGMLTDAMKYSKLDHAATVLRSADEALAAFNRGLAEVGAPAVAGVRVDTGSRTFDVWFDNIFSDIAAHGRIQQLTAQVDRARAAVATSLKRLSEDGRRIAEEVAAIDTERERLLS